MTPHDAADGQAVSGPYGEGLLCRRANGWDLIVGETVYQTIDLSQYQPTAEKPPAREVRAGDTINLGTKDKRT